MQDACCHDRRPTRWCARRFASTALAAIVATTVHQAPTSAAQVDILGPPQSGSFGTSVTVLPNGNIVVTDPLANSTALDVGKVHLYGPSGSLISTISGRTEDDQVGSGGIVVVGNSNFVVISPNFDNGLVVNAGAVTWVDGNTGRSGLVSASNSLTASTNFSSVGSCGVTRLRNGNYVVCSSSWSGPSTPGAGAATWADGNTGRVGLVSATNSLIGGSPYDQVGSNGITALSNGNYVVPSSAWDNGLDADVGAVTWADGSTGIFGLVASTNSMYGTRQYDLSSRVVALANGNFVIDSIFWDNGSISDVGAATWVNGETGASGPISPANSFVGSSTDDCLGGRVVALTNGNYVVSCPGWDNGDVANVGAVAWVSGDGPTSGAISTANSLFGGSSGVYLGGSGVVALSNGNYVVVSGRPGSSGYDDPAMITLGSGLGGLVGVASALNSLTGLTSATIKVVPLAQGNFVVCNPYWSNGSLSWVGAATWSSGTLGVTGPVSIANSLIGSRTNDQVCSGGVATLTNGNYIVGSPIWTNGTTVRVGAATWGDGNTGVTGLVSTDNSVTGASPEDRLGYPGTIPLDNGNAVVASGEFDFGSNINVGAATVMDGRAVSTGTVNSSNSLLGNFAGDFVADVGVKSLPGGLYAVHSSVWKFGANGPVGAITVLRNPGSDAAVIEPENSVIGAVPWGGDSMVFAFDSGRQQLVVGQPEANRISLLRVRGDAVLADGFE